MIGTARLQKKTKKAEHFELCRYGIKDDSECLYCGEQDSIEHTFSDCLVTKDFLSKVVQWFNNCNQSSFKPSNQ